MKQQQITYDKGITYVPSDALCSDNALSECMGMTYENGEMKPIQKAEEYITDASGISSIPFMLYIHKYNNQERYIGYVVIGNDKILCWGTRNKTTKEYVFESYLEVSYQSYISYTDYTNVTSIGKILVLSNENGMQYLLWKDDEYEYLGNDIPQPDVQFRLVSRNNTSEKGYYTNTAGLLGLSIGPDGTTCFVVNTEKQDDWNNAVVGLYSKLKRKIAQKKAFHGSFCVRAAVELYDGNYHHISNPIFMLNQFSAYGVAGITGSIDDNRVTMRIHGQELQFKFGQNYSAWGDLVKNVVLFVTKEADIVDTKVDAICTKGTYIDTTNTIPLAYYMSGRQYLGIDIVNIGKDLTNLGTTEETDIGTLYQVLEQTSDANLSNTIKDGVYYKLCEIGLNGDNTWHNAADHFDTHTIENITTQTQLGVDDYYSNSPLAAGMLYSYNSRLNLASVSRGFFGGYHNFMPFDTTLADATNPLSTYTFYVTIKTDGGDVTVSHTAQTNQIQGIYFYYPDPRARHVVIEKGTGSYVLDADLEEHPTLNGAYYFAGVSPSMVEPTTTATRPTVSTDAFELLPNYIITSEVNNPFVFRPEGYYKVGTGRIIGMSTITQALSEGQFGQFPLLVFSENGIWALTVGSTGYYTSIHPISREVCSNEKSITQTDGAVYFVSKKGLMIIVGSTVKCVSEQLDGKIIDNISSPFQFIQEPDFKGYLDNCIIAYDYRDSQLLLIDPNKGVQWVYNMKSSTFSKAKMLDATEPQKVIRVLNDYPDNLIQGDIKTIENEQEVHKYQLFSLLEKPDENGDTSTYSGTVLTRPMKLEDGLSLKTIMDLKNIYTINAQGSITLSIYGSNNCENWMEVNSLTGVPWKYYRFKIVFSNMKATDRFSGTVLVTQERRTNKLR